MGLLDRLNTLIKSNVNDLVGRMQDPAKEVDLLIDEMTETARKARADVTASVADQRRLEADLASAREEGRQWGERAEKAVLAGDDGLARAALGKQAEADQRARSLAQALDEQRVTAEGLKDALVRLEARVAEVRARRGTLRDQARRNAGQDPTSTSSKAFQDFDAFESGVVAAEAVSELDDELARDQGKDPAAEGRLRDLESKAKVDDALAALKRKMEGGK